MAVFSAETANALKNQQYKSHICGDLAGTVKVCTEKQLVCYFRIENFYNSQMIYLIL